MWLRETAKGLAGLLLAVALLWWVLRGVDPQMLWRQLGKVSILGLVLASLIGLAQNVFRVFRWRALLEPVRPAIPFRPMFDAVILGYATSWVVPGRLGELVRPALLAGRQRLPLGPCLGSVVADRLLDGMAVLALFVVGVFLTPLGGKAAQYAQVIRGAALVMVAGMGVILFLLVAVSRSRDSLERRFAAGRGWGVWILRFVLSLSQGVDALRRPSLWPRLAVHSMLTWLLIAASTWVGLRACGVDITFSGTLVLLPLLVVGIAMPTPGGAGGYHALMRVGLMELFAIEETVAVGAGLLQHAAMILPVVVLGGVLLVVDRIRIQDLVQAARQVREMGSSPPADGVSGQPAEKLS